MDIALQALHRWTASWIRALAEVNNRHPSCAVNADFSRGNPVESHFCSRDVSRETLSARRINIQFHHEFPQNI